MLNDPLTRLKGVGPALADKLAKLDLHCVEDLLFHLPLRYEDRTRITPMVNLRTGVSAQVEGTVTEARLELGKRRSLLVRLRDQQGEIGLRYYYFNAQLKSRFTPGRRFRAYGEPRLGRSGLEIYHPETELLDGLSPVQLSDVLSPVYPVTEGLAQKKIRDLCAQALEALSLRPIAESLPEETREAYGLWEINRALSFLHQPPLDANLVQIEEGKHPAQRRLILDELLGHHLSLRRIRLAQQAEQAPVLNCQTELLKRFLDELPFAPTSAQQRVIQEIQRDLASQVPMMRLVQGDVGSGKTVVACASMVEAVSNGWQAAFMAPTEILAGQHFQNMHKWLQPLGVRVVWLSGRMKAAERRDTLAAVAAGEADVVVGTHALFQDDVSFARLALVVVDEQHRFGVHQRLALRAKGAASGMSPHQLIMTATPIPRTLAMSAYADLDTSVIDELPPGRTPVTTAVLPESKRETLISRVLEVCQEGRQVYWVCPLIEESEVLQCQAAEAVWQELQSSLPGLRTGLVHGRLAGVEKARTMESFKQHELDVLVATTVIEVGVDVPNATLMVIENSERLGLAQLHQLRGRVGRGQHVSYCLLLYRPPLSQAGKARLQVMRESNDGFVIAEKDLEIRGPGEVLGTRQTGLLQFRIAALPRDKDWLPAVQEIGAALEKNSLLSDLLVQRWIGEKAMYGRV